MVRQVLFLGSPAQNSPWINYCIAEKIPFLSLYLEEPKNKKSNFPDKFKRTLPSEYAAISSSYALPLNVTLEQVVNFCSSKQFVPNFIVGVSEVPIYVDLEYALNDYYDADTYICPESARFFKYKSEQDKLCKVLGIPVIPKHSDFGLCVKRDAKNWRTVNDIPKFRAEPDDYVAKDGEFIQGWLDIDYHLGIRMYADGVGNWHLLSHNKFIYVKGTHSHIIEPYNLNAWELESVLTHIRLLCNHLTVRNRFLHMEMVKPKDEKILYHMDFNCRHGGVLQMHRTDNNALDLDYPTILFTGTPPKSKQTVFRSRVTRFFFHEYHHRFTAQQIKRIVWYEDPGLVMGTDWASCDSFDIVRHE